MRIAAFLFLLVCGLFLFAQGEEPPPQPENEQKESKGISVRAELKDGNLVVGRIVVENFEVKTAYGKLTIPVGEVYKIKVGKAADKELVEKIEKLIEQLGAEEFKDRKAAMDELLELGNVVLSDLRKALKSEDEEVRKNAETLISDIEQQFPNEEEIIDDDEIVTKRFTIRGTILQDEFVFKTKYGDLKVKKKDIKKILLGTGYTEKKQFSVGGNNLGSRGMLDTGVEVTAGAKVTIKAEGEIYIRNYGTSCGPDGTSSYGQHYPGIPMGALMGRIGRSGELFKIGAEMEFTSKKAGRLFLAVAVQERYTVTGSFSVTVKVEK